MPTNTNPGAGFAQTLYSQIAPEVNAANISNANTIGEAQAAPQLAALQQGQLQSQLQNTLAGYGLQSQQNLANLQNTQAGIGLQQQLLGSQEGIAGQQYGLSKGQIGSELGNLAYYLPQQYQNQNSSAAASGSLSTVGNQQQLGNIGQAYGYQTGQLQNQLAQLGLGYQGQQAGFAYTGGQLGLQGTQAQQAYGFGQQQIGLGIQGATTNEQYQAQQASAQGQMQQLGLNAQAYGNLANQIGSVVQQESPLGVLQGQQFNMPVPAQPNASN